METQDVRKVGRFIAYKVDVKTGNWCKRWDRPEYRKRWALIDDHGTRQTFPLKRGVLEASVERYEREGWWRLPKQESVDRCARIRKSKLTITFNEAVQGFLNLIEGEPSDKYRADWFEKALGMQRSSIC